MFSGSTGPIFTKFLPHGNCFIVDFRSDLSFSDRSRDVAMTTNLAFKLSQSACSTLILIHDPDFQL